MLVNIMETLIYFVITFIVDLKDMTLSQFNKKAADTNADGE
jgi:hypothetical protein